jgi:hypothetical protein
MPQELSFDHIENQKNDPEWIKMTPLERLYAGGLIYAADGEKITLEEYRNGMSPERKLRIEKIRLEKNIERAENKQRFLRWCNEHDIEIKNIINNNKKI